MNARIASYTYSTYEPASNQLYRILFEASSLGIIVTDWQGQIVLVNDALSRMFGYSREELIDKPLSLLLPLSPHGRQGLHRTSFSALPLSLLGSGLEVVGVDRNGAIFAIEASLSQLPLGGQVMTVVFVNNISNRKHMEEALRVSEERYLQVLESSTALNRAVLNSLGAHIAVLNEHGQIIAVNQAWERFARENGDPQLRYTGVGTNYLDVCRASANGCSEEEQALLGITAVISGALEQYTLEYACHSPIEQRWFTLRVTPLEGQQRGAVVTHENITEHKQTELSLQRSENRFRTIFHGAAVGITLTDLLGNRLMSNPALQTMLGYSDQELRTMPLTDVLHPEERAASQAMFSQLIAGHNDHYQIEQRYLHKNGEIVWGRASVSLIRNPDGTPQFAIGVIEDITHHRYAEDALRAAEAKYRTLVEQIPAIIYTAEADSSSSTSYVSPQIEAILGFTPGEWLADPELWLKQLHPDDYEYMLNHVAHTQDTDQAVPAEYRSYTRAGQVVWLQDAARMVRDEQGQPLFMQGITLDITPRKEAEEALRRSEQLYRTMASNLPNGAVLLFDRDLRFTIADGQALRTIGYTPEQIEGKTLDQILRPEIYSRLEPLYRAALQGTQNTIELIIGDRTYISYFLPVRNERNEIFAGMVMSHDITDRKQAEAALQEREAHFRALIEHSTDAVALFDLNGTIIYGSQATTHILGYPIQDFVGRNAFDLIHEEDRPEIAQHLAYVIAHPSEGIQVEARVRHADGSWRHLEGTFTNLLTDPAVGAIVNNYRDITERKRMEATLAEERALLARRVEERTADLSAANAELARAARLKDEFLASMSHELRTPLNAVLGLSEALQEEIYGTINPQQRKSLNHIEESGRHLLELINDILDLAKIGAGKMDLDISTTPVTTLCQASVRLIKQDAIKKQLSVALEIDPAVTTLQIDPRRIKQVIVNLLSNAVKFTPQGGAIGLEVCGDAEQQAVHITVWDTGIGIATDDMARLFQPFVQLDSRLARQYNGTGLGLALVYRMVELHGGCVSVESLPKAGSRFTVSLPWLTAGAFQAATTALPTAQRASLLEQAKPSANEQAKKALNEQKTLLLAEDNEANILTIQDYLHTRGYRVVVARNGAEAVEQARAIEPALIMLDIQMPDIDGIEATRRIRAHENLAQTPIIALTALAMPGDRERCLAAGADQYLSKPVSLKGLARTIEVLLDS